MLTLGAPFDLRGYKIKTTTSLTVGARPGGNAEMFPIGDLPELTECVSALAADPERRAWMSARSCGIFDELGMRRSVTDALDAIEFVMRRNGR